MSIIRVFSPLPDSEKIYEIRIQDCQPLQFVNRFIGTGILTLGVADANDAAYFLQEGCWLVTEDATPYIIVHRQQSENRVDVIAYGAHTGFDGRVTIPPAEEYAIESTGSADAVVKDFISTSLAESNRGLSITCAADQSGDEISDQSRYKMLGEEVVRVLTAAGRGEKFTWTDTGIEFDTYSGVDRSVSNTEENPVCIFAGRLKNLAGYTYKVDKTVEKTTPYVAGQGQGEEREIYVLGNDTSGWARREIFVDARDVEQGDVAKLQERGNQAKVPPGTQIIAEAQDNVNLVYGVDYNLGDIVTVQIPAKEYTKNAAGFYEKVDAVSSFDLRVTEVTITYDSGARAVDVAFGEVVRSQIAQIANDVAQLKATEAPAAAAIDLSNVEPDTIKQIIATGLTMTGSFDVAGHDLKNYVTITSSNGNTYATYPVGMSYSVIDGGNNDQDTGDDFPLGYGTLFTVKYSSTRMFQVLVQHTTDVFIYVRQYYSGFQPWQNVLTKPRPIWSGAWAGTPSTLGSSGELAGLSKYTLFMVRIAEVSTYFVAARTASGFRGIGGFGYTAGANIINMGHSISGEVLTWGTLTRFTHLDDDDHNSSSTYGTCTLSEIWGLV